MSPDCRVYQVEMEAELLRVADNGVAASWSSIISSRSFLQFLQHNEQASKGKLCFFFQHITQKLGQVIKSVCSLCLMHETPH